MRCPFCAEEIQAEREAAEARYARYRELGGTKPIVITEFGPPGTWEIGMTSFGAPPELTSTEIAERLVVSANTVRTHVQHIYQKLDVHSRYEAVVRARDLGLI